MGMRGLSTPRPDSPSHEVVRENGSPLPRMTSRRLSGQGKRSNHGWEGAASPFGSFMRQATVGRWGQGLQARIKGKKRGSPPEATSTKKNGSF